MSIGDGIRMVTRKRETLERLGLMKCLEESKFEAYKRLLERIK
jgi:hypothetical protein